MATTVGFWSISDGFEPGLALRLQNNHEQQRIPQENNKSRDIELHLLFIFFSISTENVVILQQHFFGHSFFDIPLKSHVQRTYIVATKYTDILIERNRVAWHGMAYRNKFDIFCSWNDDGNDNPKKCAHFNALKTTWWQIISFEFKANSNEYAEENKECWILCHPNDCLL